MSKQEIIQDYYCNHSNLWPTIFEELETETSVLFRDKWRSQKLQ